MTILKLIAGLVELVLRWMRGSERASDVRQGEEKGASDVEKTVTEKLRSARESSGDDVVASKLPDDPKDPYRRE